MSTCNDKTHIKVLLSSLKKIYNKARVSGELEIKELYYLNMISKMLNTLELKPEEIKKLETFYMDLSYYSNNICRPEIIKSYTTTKKSFVQGTKYHCDNTPLPDYNEKSCVYLETIETAAGGTGILPLNLKVDYITCENVSVTDNYTFTVSVIEQVEINQCIKENTLLINNNLVASLNDTLIFIVGVGPDATTWEVRFTASTCFIPS